MKFMFFVITFIVLSSQISMSQTVDNLDIPNGLYLISELGTDTTEFGLIEERKAVIKFNYLIINEKDQKYNRILVDLDKYVPLCLQKPPEAVQQTEIKKNLVFSLTEKASEQLKVFTTNHIMQKIALVVDGEAVSIHKIREPIIHGQIQITTCSDNACERLIVKIKNDKI